MVRSPTDAPSAGLARLLQKGAIDSVLQVAATSLARMGLVLAVPVMAPFVSLEALGRFDLFIVGSSLVLIAVSLGMDSGLAIVNSRKSPAGRRALLMVTLGISFAVTVLLGTVLWLLTSWIPNIAGTEQQLVFLTLLYGALNAEIIIIFNWFRWQQRAVASSLMMIAANVVSFACAAILFAVFGTIIGFVSGLIAGSALGLAGVLALLVRNEELSLRDLRIFKQASRLRRMGAVILGVSLPYMTASVSLVLRRVIDRSFLLTLGDPALLGAYAIVARAAELIGFAFALPAVGFAPIFVARHAEAATRRLARLCYIGYVCLSVVVVVLVVICLPTLLWQFDVAQVADIAGLLAPILVGTLFLGELSIAGFGYVIKRRPRQFSILSLAFLLAYVGLLWLLTAVGMGVEAIGWAFAVTSFMFTTAAVEGSERLYRLGYPSIPIVIAKFAMLALALWALGKGTRGAIAHAHAGYPL